MRGASGWSRVQPRHASRIAHKARGGAHAEIVGWSVAVEVAAEYTQSIHSKRESALMLKLTRFFVSIAAICLIALLTATVNAADITVDSSCGLADAIIAANSDTATGGCPAGSGADTITLTGDVTLTAALPEIESEITIEGNGYTISGNEQHQIFWVEEDGALTIQNATLADGRGVDDDDLFDDDLIIGGGILNFGSVDIRDSVFANHTADWGGAILNLGEAKVTISNSTFTGNTAKEWGAAIISLDESTVSISGSNFTGNTSDDLGGWAICIVDDAKVSISSSSFSDNVRGVLFNTGESNVSNSSFSRNLHGVISNQKDATLSITGSSFSNNSSLYQGVVVLNMGDVNIRESNFTSNSAILYEGGMKRQGGVIFNAGNASVADSVFTANSSELGGAIINVWNSIVSIRESSFMNNAATEGGAIDNYGRASIRGSIFTGNSATEDGGAIDGNSKHVVLTVTDSVFIGNSAGDEGGAIRNSEDSEVEVSQSMFRDNSAEDGGAIYSWAELNVIRSTFINNSAVEEGGGIANHSTASIKDSILADNPGGDCHLGRKGELFESGNNHISDGTCRATWSGPLTDGYCPPGQEQDGVCQIGAPSSIGESE